MVDRAIVSYLRTLNIVPPAQINAGYSSPLNTYPNITVVAKSGQQDPEPTGNDKCVVDIMIKASAVQVAQATNPPKPQANIATARVNLDLIVGQVKCIT